MIQKKRKLMLGCALLSGLLAFAQSETGRQEHWVDCPTPWGAGYHLVQPGETLYAIARTYDIAMSDLILWNKLGQSGSLTVCQQLYVTDPRPEDARATNATPSTSLQAAKAAYAASSTPVAVQQGRLAGPDGALYAERPASNGQMQRVHIVQIGERLPAIARAYGYSEAQLRKLNNLPAEGDLLIFPGDVLYLDSKAAVPAIAPPPRVVLEGEPSDPVAVADPFQQVAKGGAQVFEEVSVLPAAPTRSVAASGPASEPEPMVQVQRINALYFSEHVVRMGETLHAVAEKHQLTAEELAQVNSLLPDAALVPGTVLQIPNH
jgi:LysM repeat protein